MAMLNYVQLQVLDAKDKVLIDNLDNSTRSDWDDHRVKNLTWSVPTDWSLGRYTLRAFGNASYPCMGEDGRRKFCMMLLEDRQTIYLQQPPSSSSSLSNEAGQQICTGSDTTTTTTTTTTTSKILAQQQDDGSGSSCSSDNNDSNCSSTDQNHHPENVGSGGLSADEIQVEKNLFQQQQQQQQQENQFVVGKDNSGGVKDRWATIWTNVRSMGTSFVMLMVATLFF
ncbi:hypothetical protein BGZ65_006680 [Modicella reniformis]|uniref:Uncharacterized protein n=1 Tax=Modicella reniformis TaxID=1440133 RepID=A0A9P6LTU5_9FUNG|nr:hypothetical protein BGZ65_006680 [Modicella reniformis]